MSPATPPRLPDYLQHIVLRKHRAFAGQLS